MARTKKKKQETLKLPYWIERLFEEVEIEKVSQQAKDDLKGFYSLIIEQKSLASKNTHYDKLNEWSDPLYAYIHKMLQKYRFVNGNPEANKKLPDALFWWGIYLCMSNVIYSLNLNTQVARHHASAWERNEVLVIEVLQLMEMLGVQQD